MWLLSFRPRCVRAFKPILDISPQSSSSLFLSRRRTSTSRQQALSRPLAVSRSFGLSFYKDLNEPLHILLCCFAPRAGNHTENPPPTCLPFCLVNSQRHLLSLFILPWCISLWWSIFPPLYFLLSPPLLFCHTFHGCVLFYILLFSPIPQILAVPVLLP